MFKVLILQAMHSLSDERAENLIMDRLSFTRFLGLGLADPVPDANTNRACRKAPKPWTNCSDSLELPRFGGRFAGQDGLIRSSRLLSYSIGER